MTTSRSVNTGPTGPWFVRMRVYLLLPALFLCTQPGFAAQETGGWTSPDPIDGTNLDRASEIGNELARRQQLVEQLQFELGQYDSALIEAHDDLGMFFQEAGDFEQATTHYREALQLTRINTGLNSNAQLPFIEKLIFCSLSMQNWQQADTLSHLRYYLKSQLYQPSDIEYADAIVELADWKIRTLRENLLDDGYRELGLAAEELRQNFRDGIDRVEQFPGLHEASLVRLYQGKSHADLEVARILADTPYEFFQGTVNPYVYDSVCRNVVQGSSGTSRQCTSVRRANPLYPESQRTNKRMLVLLSVRELENSLEHLNQILSQHPQQPADEDYGVAGDIRELHNKFREFKTTNFSDCCTTESPLASR